MAAMAYLGLIIFIIFTELLRAKENKFDFLLYFNVIFCLTYPFPAFLLAADLAGKTSDHLLGFKLNLNDPQILIAILVGYFFILLGFYSKSSQEYGKLLKIEWHNEKIILRIALSLLFNSFISTQMYGLQFGGVLNAISRSAYIRQNIAEEVGVLGFFQHFMFLSYVASYLLASLIVFKRINQNKLLIYGAFVVSVMNSISAATITAARGHMIYFGLTFYITYIVVNRKFPWTSTIILLMPISLFMIYGKLIFFSLSGIPDGFSRMQELFVEGMETQANEGSSGFDSLVNNFSFTLYSLKAALYTEYPLRLFVDWIYALITFVPERLLNVTVPDTITTLNTQYIAKTNDFEIPTALFAFGIYSLSWPGLIIVCFSYGWIGRYLETIFLKHIRDTAWMPFLYVIAAQVWIDLYTAGDPRVFLFADFWALVGCFILFAFGSKIFFVKHQKY